MANKMTKKDWYAAIAKVVSGADMEDDVKAEALAFIDHEVELLNRKTEKSGLTARQKENIGVMSLIKDALFEVAKPVTITELLAATPALREYTPQRVSALLKQLKDKGEVIRTEEKKKAYFSLAE